MFSLRVMLWDLHSTSFGLTCELRTEHFAVLGKFNHVFYLGGTTLNVSSTTAKVMTDHLEKADSLRAGNSSVCCGVPTPLQQDCSVVEVRGFLPIHGFESAHPVKYRRSPVGYIVEMNTCCSCSELFDGVIEPC